jgi:CheY-like chemotaxis protein
MADKRILLIEDNPDDEKLTLRAFKKNNIVNPVTVARDGAEAIELLTGADAQAYALVLLDLRLPKVHGLEVLKRMRADPRTRLVPVVILTSSKEESDLVQGYALGANSYVRKPVDFKQFVEAAAQLGMYWLVLNEVPGEKVREPAPAGG